MLGGFSSEDGVVCLHAEGAENNDDGVKGEDVRNSHSETNDHGQDAKPR